MSITNKLILSGVALSFLAAMPAVAQVAPARAAGEKTVSESSEPQMVIFRVEDIKPITNANGMIDKCSYLVTAFNRMEKTLKNARLELQWADNISAKYVIKDGGVSIVDKGNEKTVVADTVELREIAPHTQKSFEEEVETDKCFLLLDNVEFKAYDCIMDGIGAVTRGEDKGECSGLFNYIDSKNPEYYSEFKDLPDSVIKKQAEEEKVRELSLISKLHDQIKDDMDKTVQTLEKIK